MNYGMKGKVALVVGGGAGSAGITSKLLAQEGVKVVIADFDEVAASKTVDQIKADGGEATCIKCNVVNEQDIIDAVNLTVKTYGGLNYALNFVGTNTDFSELELVPSENFDKMLHITTRSTFYGMKYQIPEIRKAGGGVIVNMASLGGLVGQRKQGLYNAAKFAVVGMTKAAALDYAAENIRVNCICPGPMMSDGMRAAIANDPKFADQYLVDVPMGRFVEQEHVAQAFVWLCSELAGSVTGVALPVDCGMVAD